MAAMTQTLRSTSLVTSNLPIPSPLGSLEAYIGAVHQIPVLTVDEEQDLARRFRDEEDLDAARELVHSHLRFVVHVARGYSGYGLQLGDLIQEGNIGLMKAVKRFDPDIGVRLVSFAVHWIRAEMHEFILRNWRIVKVATTKAQRKLFFNLRSQKKRLAWLSNDEVHAVAESLGVEPREVREMESRLSGQDMAFDPAADADDEWAARGGDFALKPRFDFPETVPAGGVQMAGTGGRDHEVRFPLRRDSPDRGTGSTGRGGRAPGRFKSGRG